jgi:hypothetical protein
MFPGTAGADVQTIDFESGALNSPLNGQGDVSFPLGSGFRPYHAEVGARAQSGTRVGDLGRCVEEVDARGGDPIGCEFFQARTKSFLSRTARSVTLFAGRIGPVGPFDPAEAAVLTAFRADGTQLATTGPVTLDPKGVHTRMSVSSAAGNIASFSVEATSAADLGIDDVTVEFADGGAPDFSVGAINQVLALVQGQRLDVPVQITRLNGSSGRIELSASDLPKGVSAAPVTVSGTQTTATITLVADPTAPDTAFVPQEAKLTATPRDGTAGRTARTVPMLVRVAAEFELSSGPISAREQGQHGAIDVEAPPCAPIDVPVRITRDIAMNRDIALKVGHSTPEGLLTDLPAGVSAEILPNPVVSPGGGLAAERTIRFRVDPRADFNLLTVALQGRTGADPAGSARSLRFLVSKAKPTATIATSTPGSGLGRTPRYGGNGTAVRVHGNGFCPGTSVEVGNSLALAEARLIDDHTIEFNVPRNATTRRLLIHPPEPLAPYRSEDRLTVDSFRNVNGFQFDNYNLGSISLGEMTEAFGADDLFIKINPCWPFGNCTVVTGILNPLAALNWGVINTVVPMVNRWKRSGHCFGMSLAVHRFLSGRESLRRFKAYDTPRPARAVYELGSPGRPGEVLSSFLDAQQISAFSSEVLDAYFHRPISMDAHLKTLEDEFRRKRPVLVQVSSNSPFRAHVVVAYDMEQDADSADLYIYENNRPFLREEERDGSRHDEALKESVIHIDKAKEEWTMPWPGAPKVGGGESFWAIPGSAIPDDPSMPGLGTLKSALGWLLFGPGDGAVRTVAEGTYLPLPVGSLGGAEAGARPASADAGTWIGEGSGRPLEVEFIGVEPGTYTQAYSGSGFYATTEALTAKGVHDTVTGRGDSFTVESGISRPLEIDLAKRSGDALTTAATLNARASAGGTDSAGFTEQGTLTYAHQGAPTQLELTLTTVRRNGGPASFASGPIRVGRDDRLWVRPVGRDLRRVRLTVRDSSGRKSSRVLRNQGRPRVRLRLGRAKLSGRRLSVPVRVATRNGRAIAGVALRVVRDGRVVGRKAVSMKLANASRTITWRLPRSLADGRYRLLADARAIPTARRGVTAVDSTRAHRAAEVWLGR